MARIIVAGLSGGSGKTIASLALLLAVRERGCAVRAFKKGPDYIDPAWLAWASGHPARNLDTYLMGFDTARQSFARHAVPGGLNLIEGNRGLYDGCDAAGTHSTAELAKALDCPVLLVVNTSKATRTVAATVLGCRMLDPTVRIAGVVLNQVCGSRHERVLRDAVEGGAGVPVWGSLPRAAAGSLPAERHLGLMPPAEHGGGEALRRTLLALAAGLDVDRILEAADRAPAIATLSPAAATPVTAPRVRIGYVRDAAFTFYYPDNLEALEAAGAILVPVSALEAAGLPPNLGALYIGGGFPEMHAAALSANVRFLDSLCAAARAGLPVYAECGGLMLLSRAVGWNGAVYPMAGVLGCETEVCAAPQGHGYVRLSVDHRNPFFAPGTTLRGHEFHYSRIVGDPPATACAVTRGTGCTGGRDAVVADNVWASYSHVHALATPEWAPALVAAARRYAALTAPRRAIC